MIIETKVQFSTGRAGQKRLRSSPKQKAEPLPQRVPRISRLMALAIHFDGLIRKGIVRDYADLARLGGVTRARITQIMNLLNLSPEIQERLLFLPDNATEQDAVVNERYTRGISASLDWAMQGRHYPIRTTIGDQH